MRNPKLIGKKKCAVCDDVKIRVRLSFDTNDKDVRLIFYFCTLSHLKASMGTIDWIKKIAKALDPEISI